MLCTDHVCLRPFIYLIYYSLSAKMNTMGVSFGVRCPGSNNTLPNADFDIVDKPKTSGFTVTVLMEAAGAF